jgi:hypothetical protein
MAAAIPTASASSRVKETERLQMIRAPQRPEPQITIFLAGTITSFVWADDWRAHFTTSLSSLDAPLTVFNPHRPDWTWPTDLRNADFRTQTQWEFDHLMKASIICFYFGMETESPIGLLELGMTAALRKSIVCVHPEYKKKGNVEFVCEKYGLTLVWSKSKGLEELVEATRQRIATLSGK